MGDRGTPGTPRDTRAPASVSRAARARARGMSGSSVPWPRNTGAPRPAGLASAAGGVGEREVARERQHRAEPLRRGAARRGASWRRPGRNPASIMRPAPRRGSPPRPSAPRSCRADSRMPVLVLPPRTLPGRTSYQARMSMPALIVTGRTRACGNTNRTGVPKPVVGHHRFEVAAVGAEAVHPDDGRLRAPGPCSTPRGPRATPGLMDGLRPVGDGLRPVGDGLRPVGDGLRPVGDGLRPGRPSARGGAAQWMLLSQGSAARASAKRCVTLLEAERGGLAHCPTMSGSPLPTESAPRRST